MITLWSMMKVDIDHFRDITKTMESAKVQKVQSKNRQIVNLDKAKYSAPLGT